MKTALVDSFYNYEREGLEYPFVDRSELKPKSKRMEKESALDNTFIVIFCEGKLQPQHKTYIRFFPENAVIKKNLSYLANFALYKRFHRNLRYFETPGFFDLVEGLLNIDYALLIQQDPTVVKRNRYALTHFHVKIDWPIAEAAQDLAKGLRYIQNHLYENGDKQGRILQNKLFEYYGCHHSVGGRRTAGLIAAQLLRSLDCISTAFVSSSESRSMYKYSESGVSKFFLVQLNDRQIEELSGKVGGGPDAFKTGYLYPAEGFSIGIAEARYSHTAYGRPPEDGKLRKLKPAYNWLRLEDEFLHPRITALNAQPISYNWVYSSSPESSPRPPS